MIKMMKGNRKNGRSTFQILSLFSPGAQVNDMLHPLFCSCLTFSFIYAASLFFLIGLMSAISGSSSVSHCSPTFTWIDFFGIYPSAPSASQK